MIRLCQAALTAVLFIFLLSSHSVNAGFLEMPDTTEVPEMERESMLKDLDIPPVRDRDPDPMAGPRLNITEFRVQGIVEFPELGITRQSLMKLVEGIRFDLMREGEMLESGYTLEEMSEISDLVADIEEETEGESVGPLDVQRLVFLIRDQRRRRGVTLGMIEAVADTITRYYRERGFILAKAYIPEQRVRDGVVTLTLLLGNLGEVAVHNNKKYTAKTIQNIFKPNLNKPVKSDVIEEKLFFVNDLPGLNAQAFFEPGSQVGDTKLSVNVLQEDLLSANVRVDNHGSASTGEYRIYSDFYWANPAGWGDQLHVGLLATVEPANSLYGSIHYGIPLLHQRAKWSFGGSTNDFVSNTITGLSLTGKSYVVDTSFNYILQRSRAKNYSVEFRANQIYTDIDQELGDIQTQRRVNQDEFDTKSRNIDLVFNFDVLLDSIHSLHQGGVRLTSSEILQEYKRVNQKDVTPIIALDYSFLTFFKFPFTDANTRVLFKVSGQYAETSIASTSQFSLAGPNKMRSLEINQYNSDSGIYAGVDWMFSGPKFLSANVGGTKLSDIVQPYLFFEGAYGDTTPPGGIIGQASPGLVYHGTWLGVYGAGLGVKFAYGRNFRGGLSYAHVLNYLYHTGTVNTQGVEVNQTETSLDNQYKIYFDLQYSF